jgi:hypothetical protein
MEKAPRPIKAASATAQNFVLVIERCSIWLAAPAKRQAGEAFRQGVRKQEFNRPFTAK